MHSAESSSDPETGATQVEAVSNREILGEMLKRGADFSYNNLNTYEPGLDEAKEVDSVQYGATGKFITYYEHG